MIEKIAEKVFKISKAQQTEIMFYHNVEALTRFGQNQITQHVESDNQSMTIRMLDNKRTASISVSNFSDSVIEKAVEQLYNILKMQIPDERLSDLPENLKYISEAKKSESFARLDESTRAEYVKESIDYLIKESSIGAGICSQTNSTITHITNKNYFHTYHDWKFSFSLSAKNNYGITREEFNGTTLEKFNPEELAEKCIYSLKLLKDKKKIDAGKYDVILTPAAFAELLLYLFYFSFSAKAYHEKRTFMVNKKGQQIFSPLLTIIDRPRTDEGPALFYDFEGSPTTNTVLVDKGVCNNLVSNKYYSKILNIPNTGNCLSPTTLDCYPLRPEVLPGKKSLKTMIEESDNVLLINRLHYLNIIDPLTLMVTGMTRDGVFTIEKGKITKSTNNLRFTESILTALSNIEELSSDTYECEYFLGFMNVPAVKIKNFNFSSVTDF
ncbi:MAG TPA: metallopeptidase TldD-related protein [Exilispira sp.]|nr:metallopeptidase TldD-related protein [Exilispira sp.]